MDKILEKDIILFLHEIMGSIVGTCTFYVYRYFDYSKSVRETASVFSIHAFQK